MEQSEINSNDISRIIEDIRKSKNYTKRQRATSSSVKLYCSLLCRYDVKPACDICIHIDEDTHICRLSKLYTHKCDQNRLVLFRKNATDGELLRKRPTGYNPLRTDRICEHVGLNELCLEKHLCPYPHTHVERDLWKEEYYDRLAISSLVHDIRMSSLLFSAVLECLSKKFGGTFKLICRSCYQESGEVVTKRHHVPECQSSSSHYWGDSNKKLVFESSSADLLVGFDAADVHDGEEQELVDCVISLMKNVSIDEIAEEAARLRQVMRSARSDKAREADREKSRHEVYDPEFDDSDDDIRLSTTDEEVFDRDAADVLSEAAFDADTGDSVDKSGSKSRVKGGYYKMLTTQQTENDPEAIYGCGKIELDGAFAGSCTIVGGQLNGCTVELRGRYNCGPAFDGDEVRVKVPKKDESQDSETNSCTAENSGTDNSAKFCGTVVNVIKRNVTARTFVCTVGRHDGNLMTPLCGTAPKFKILDRCLHKRYGPVKKDNYVAVYSTDLELTQTVRLDPCKRREMLFVVKYLKWEYECKYPLGYVCCILRNSRSGEESQKILNLIHKLPTNKNTDPDEELAEQEEEEGVKTVERKDLCNLLTVSIDAPGTKAIDDALSLEESDVNFVVWIHVTDVTHYVQKDDHSCHDVYAQKRMVSFCSLPRRPVHMLPKKLAEDKCSLLENSRRRAMSVQFKLTADGEVLSFEGPSPSWIQNDRQLFYEDVQEVIDCDSLGVQNYDDQAVDRNTEQMLIRLHKLATELRKQRMGDGSHYYEYSRKHCSNSEGIGDFLDVDQCHDARRLVEEFMILTNMHVGKMLKHKFPNCTPFLLHSAPKNELLDNWKTNHDCIIPFSFFFSQFARHLGDGHDEPAIIQLLMLRSCLAALNAAVDENEVKKVRTIIGSELLHPLHGIALSSWFDIQEPSHYACYVDDAVHTTWHFGLQTSDYVHFTSPLRRYADIIVHRLLKADPDQQPPYTQEEVMALCESMNSHLSRQRLYDKDCELLNIADMLQKTRPMYIPCYVETFNDFSISLVSPYFQTFLPLARKLNFSEMTLDNNPVPCDEKLTLTWSKRYYDTRMSMTTNARPDSVTKYVLDSGMFGTTVLPRIWRSMHRAVKEQAGNLTARMKDVVRPLEQQQLVQQKQQQEREIVQEVTSEMADNKPLIRHHVNFSCEITKGTVLSVQFGAKAVKGFLQPVINLLNLTNDKDICVEHQRDPVTAFASVATKKTKDAYQGIEEYQNIWLEILAMEAATNVVRNETVVCSHVPITFIKRNDRIYGTLKLSKEFCDKRSISVFATSEQEETHDYVCIRYFLKATRLAKSFIRNVWVAHAAVKSCSCRGDVIKLVKCNCEDRKTPSELLEAREVRCTVEFLPRTLPDK